MNIIWSLSGVIAYKNDKSTSFMVMEDRYQYLVVGPDVSALPEIVALMADLNLPTKEVVIDPNITDLKFRFSVLDAETNNTTIEVGGASGGFRVRDANYGLAIAALSNRPFFIGYFSSSNINYLFDGTFYLENADVADFPTSDNSRSMFGWVRPSSENSTRKVLFGYGPSDTNRANDHNVLVYNTNLQKEVKFWGESIDQITDANNALTVGSWNFVGMVYDGSVLTLYVNDRSWSINTVSLDTGSGAFRIGLGMSSYAAITDLFVGDISNVSVFNVSKDRTYVNALKALGRIGYDQIPLSFLYDSIISNLEIGDSDSKEAVLTTVHVESTPVTSVMSFASGGIVTWEVASLEGSTLLSDLQAFSGGDIETLLYQSSFLLDPVGPIEALTPTSTTAELQSITIEDVSEESDLFFRDQLGDASKGTAVSISYTTSDFIVSGGDKLQSVEAIYKGPMSYWDLSETKGTRYDSVAQYHLTPISIAVDFTANATSNFNIAFKDTTFPLASKWFWDFGDGTISVLQNPSHEYALVGDYNVKLTVDNGLSVTHQATAIEYLVVDPMDGSPLVGELHGNAVYGFPFLQDHVHLTSKVQFTYGAVDYNNTSNPSLPTDKRLTIEYEFFADGAADAVYFYMFNTSIPEQEDFGANGYVVYCSEYRGEVAVCFNGENINRASYGGLGNATWRSIKIVYLNQIITVYINDVVVLIADDSAFARAIALNPFYGVAARCGAAVAQHRVRNLKIYV